MLWVEANTTRLLFGVARVRNEFFREPGDLKETVEHVFDILARRRDSYTQNEVNGLDQVVTACVTSTHGTLLSLVSGMPFEVKEHGS